MIEYSLSLQLLRARPLVFLEKSRNRSFEGHITHSFVTQLRLMSYQDLIFVTSKIEVDKEQIEVCIEVSYRPSRSQPLVWTWCMNGICVLCSPRIVISHKIDTWWVLVPDQNTSLWIVLMVLMIIMTSVVETSPRMQDLWMRCHWRRTGCWIIRTGRVPPFTGTATVH